jgi:uncharacterized repeat protein (TIGR03833 family)
MNGKNRKDIKPGLRVNITQKHNQQSGRLPSGIVQDILTQSASHPYGIKVRLQTGDTQFLAVCRRSKVVSMGSRKGIEEARVFADDEPCNGEEIRHAAARLYARQSVIP